MFSCGLRGGAKRGRWEVGVGVAAKSKLWIYAAGDRGQAGWGVEGGRRPGVGHSARGGSR